jgi:hypothetical protein
MNRPVFVLLAVAVLFPATGAAGAAPVPDEDKAARKELERLKERLPEVLTGWVKKRWYPGHQAKLRVIRRIGPGEAKVWILIENPKDAEWDEALTLYLRYYRGAWFTTRFEGTWQSDNPLIKQKDDKAARFLMMAVDEAGGK